MKRKTDESKEHDASASAMQVVVAVDDKPVYEEEVNYDKIMAKIAEEEKAFATSPMAFLISGQTDKFLLALYYHSQCEPSPPPNLEALVQQAAILGNKAAMKALMETIVLPDDVYLSAAKLEKILTSAVHTAFLSGHALLALSMHEWCFKKLNKTAVEKWKSGYLFRFSLSFTLQEELANKGYLQGFRLSRDYNLFSGGGSLANRYSKAILTSPEPRIALAAMGSGSYQLYEMMAVLRYNRVDVLEEMMKRDTQAVRFVETGAAIWCALASISECNKEDAVHSTVATIRSVTERAKHPLGASPDFSKQGTADGPEERGFTYYVDFQLCPRTSSYLVALDKFRRPVEAEQDEITKLILQ